MELVKLMAECKKATISPIALNHCAKSVVYSLKAKFELKTYKKLIIQNISWTYVPHSISMNTIAYGANNTSSRFKTTSLPVEHR